MITILIGISKNFVFTSKLSAFYRNFYLVFFLIVSLMALAYDLLKPE